MSSSVPGIVIGNGTVIDSIGVSRSQIWTNRQKEPFSNGSEVI